MTQQEFVAAARNGKLAYAVNDHTEAEYQRMDAIAAVAVQAERAGQVHGLSIKLSKTHDFYKRTFALKVSGAAPMKPR